MTLDQWLEEATGSFPRGVRERLAQEYGAHLEDSGAASGSGDALELFGDPKALKRKLKKLYVSQERIEQVNKVGRNLRWMWGISLFLILFSLKSVIIFYNTPLFTHFLINFSIITAPFLLLWLLTYHLKKIRRAYFQTSMFPTALSISPFYGLIFEIRDQLDVFTGLTLLSVIIFTSIYIIIEERRVTRTLKIEGYSQGNS